MSYEQLQLKLDILDIISSEVTDSKFEGKTDISALRNVYQSLARLIEQFKEDHGIFEIDVNKPIDTTRDDGEFAARGEFVLFPTYILRIRQFTLQLMYEFESGRSTMGHQAPMFLLLVLNSLIRDNNCYFMYQLQSKYDPRKHEGPSLLQPAWIFEILNSKSPYWLLPLLANTNVQEYIDKAGDNFLAPFMKNDGQTRIALTTVLAAAVKAYPIEAVFWPNKVRGSKRRMGALAYCLKTLSPTYTVPREKKLMSATQPQVLALAQEYVKETRPSIKRNISEASEEAMPEALTRLIVEYLDGGFEL